MRIDELSDHSRMLSLNVAIQTTSQSGGQGGASRSNASFADELQRLTGVEMLMELLMQVPFSLVGGIVARLTHHVADSRHLEREIVGPWEVCIIEHLRVLDVLTGENDRA